MRNGLSDHNERAMLGADLRQVKRRQSKPFDSVGIPLKRVSAQYPVEWLVLKARVSGQDDDVRRFLRVEPLISKSSCAIRLISLHIGSQTYWTEKCHGL